jgi:putative intracellular protease/amidase
MERKKIAVLVESEYIPGEISAYLNQFKASGFEVELMSRLWGAAIQTFVSDVDEAADTIGATRLKLETMDVQSSFEDKDPDEYVAVLVAANYVSVRLRYFEPPAGPDGKPHVITPEMARNAPAVRFIARAMRNPQIVKGFLCHALWLLTPMPELLAGRKVICHEVVISDITNAGAIYTPVSKETTSLQPYPGVVVDGDLVTGRSKVEAENGSYTQVIKDTIRKLQEHHQTAERSSTRASQPASGKKSILVVLSNWGYWGEELVGPLEVFTERGYDIEFATPRGRRPQALPPSMDSEYVDPPLGRPVTTPEMAAKVREIHANGPENRQYKKSFDSPHNLSELIPERPYFSQPALVRGLEAYYRRRNDALMPILDRFDALLLVGGSGPIVDMANNQQVHDLVLGFLRAGKPIAAECYAVTCLAFARDIENRESIIRNKHVTGHCLEYDYRDGTGFVGTDFNMGPPPYPLEYILRDATSPNGQYHGNFGKETSVIVDYPFVTGRSTPDSSLTGQKLVEVLENRLTRWGW